MSGARSVSLKKPPSMWGTSSNFAMSSWICGDSWVFEEGEKLGLRTVAILKQKRKVNKQVIKLFDI